MTVRSAVAAQDVATRVIALVAQEQRLPLSRVTIDSTFEELGMDSLDGVNLYFAIGKEFDLWLAEDLVRELRSVREVVDALLRFA
jgi:acyl carrier protein